MAGVLAVDPSPLSRCVYMVFTAGIFRNVLTSAANWILLEDEVPFTVAAIKQSRLRSTQDYVVYTSLRFSKWSHVGQTQEKPVRSPQLRSYFKK
ncbi:MAG: hypothetical protein Q9159_003268 [Coniocarpon cinnabarinum]